MNYIDGEWQFPRSGETLASHNPATGELIGSSARSEAEIGRRSQSGGVCLREMA